MVALVQGSKAWLDSRIGVITGSRVGGILGVNPFKSRDEVMREMVREAHSAEREFQGNAATDHGTKMEPTAIAWYEREYNCKVEETDMVLHPEYEWLGMSPDGIVGEERFIEAKCPFYAKRCYTIAEKPMYEYQIRLGHECLEIPEADFIVYFNPKKTHVEPVFFDPLWLPRHIDVLAKFHKEYLAIVKSEKRSKKHLDPVPKHGAIVQDSEFVELTETLMDLDELNKQVKPKEERVKELRQLLGERHGDCTNEFTAVTVVEKKGAVDYSGLLKQVMKDVPGAKAFVGDLDAHRKPGTKAYSAKLIGGK